MCRLRKAIWIKKQVKTGRRTSLRRADVSPRTVRRWGPRGVMPVSLATGQAAGTAAVLAVKNGICFKEVNVGELREELRKNSAVMDLPSGIIPNFYQGSQFSQIDYSYS